MRILILLLLSTTFCGCATVKPWQKQVLAQPIMAWKQDSRDAAFLDHARITVEQAEGGSGGAGGGCGCR